MYMNKDVDKQQRAKSSNSNVISLLNTQMSTHDVRHYSLGHGRGDVVEEGGDSADVLQTTKFSPEDSLSFCGGTRSFQYPSTLPSYLEHFFELVSVLRQR